jgi:hypothetical protein
MGSFEEIFCWFFVELFFEIWESGIGLVFLWAEIKEFEI